METDHLTGLRQMMGLQAALQVKLGNDVGNMSMDQLMAYVREQTLACTDELHEALQETGWKTWAKNPHINQEAFADELIDAWLFLMNLMNVAGMTAEQLYVGHAKKVVNATKRNDEKYDGVSTKCPLCRRAYDNDAVRCVPGKCEAVTFVTLAEERANTIGVPLQVGTFPRMRDTV
jgi:hypothetical protein